MSKHRHLLQAFDASRTKELARLKPYSKASVKTMADLRIAIRANEVDAEGMLAELQKPEAKKVTKTTPAKGEKEDGSNPKDQG